ncbi:MAG: DUF4349 domain-containing protein [Chitinophagaceae bacterium]|nr:DUF4349 domain-containing protein [Chitinophagaceae bacterium]
MKKALFAFAICIAVVACNQKESKKSQVADFDAPIADSAFQSSPPENERKEVGNKIPQSSIPLEKKIVKTATITVVTDSIEKFRSYLKSTVAKVNGYFSNENFNQNSDTRSLQIVAKIPVDQFDQFIENALQYDLKVEQKAITAEDVTGEFRDAKLMADTKRQVRLRYLDMLSKARNVTEMLEVQNAINAVQEDIDMYQGRALYLTQTAAYSTLDITVKSRFDSSENSTWLKWKQAFLNGLNGVAAFAQIILTLWPLWVVLGIFYLAFKEYKRKNSIASKS